MRFASFLLTCFLVSAAGCDSDADSELDGPPNLDPDFVTTLAIKDTTGQFRDSFSPGEQIVFEVSVTNRRNRPLTATRASTQRSDFFVAPADSRQIFWWWSSDQAFLDVVETDEFAAGETKTFSVMWDQHRDDGLPLLSGEYVVRGFYAAWTANLPANFFTHSEFGSVLIPFAIE